MLAYQTLDITGPDAPRFLQSLITSNIEKLPLHQGTISYCLNRKGRIGISFFLLHCDTHHYQCICPESTIETLMKHFQRYNINFKLEFTQNKNYCSALEACANDFLENMPVGHLHQEKALRYFKVSPSHLLCIHPSAKLTEDQSTIQASSLLSHEEWQLALIQNHLLEITPKIQSMFLPQEAGLFAHKNAISVKKGCYLGQEIVARLHFLGQAKKILQGFYYPEKINIALLDEVMQNDKKIGSVVSHASHNNKTWLLCIINKQALENTQASLKLGKHPEPLVHIKRPI